jgi:outer membrane protein assembly factor BamB
VYAINADGKIAWRTQLPEEVKDVAVLGDRVVAACDDGRVYVLDRNGHIIGQTELSDAPRCVAAMSADTFVASSGNRVTAIGITH